VCDAKSTGRGNRRGTVALALAAVACGLALAACGSSGKPHEPSADAGLKFAACMRSHGVPNLPDPGGGGGGIQIPSGSGINPSSPAFQSAQKACSKLLPFPTPGGAGSETRKLAMLKLARCMRSHGISAFPDPTSSPPSAPPNGGVAFGAGGSFLSVPQSLIQSPGFKRDAAACHFPGFGGSGSKATAVG
jgi:hypothetical protein